MQIFVHLKKLLVLMNGIILAISMQFIQTSISLRPLGIQFIHFANNVHDIEYHKQHALVSLKVIMMSNQVKNHLWFSCWINGRYICIGSLSLSLSLIWCSIYMFTTLTIGKGNNIGESNNTHFHVEIIGYSFKMTPKLGSMTSYQSTSINLV